MVPAALALPNGRDVKYGVALALAFAGDAASEQARVEKIADDLASRFPDDTMVQFNYLPTVRAQLALNGGDPSKAIDTLQPAAPYELGTPGSFAFPLALFPVTCVVKPIWPRIGAAKPRRSFRKPSIILGLCLTSPLARLRTCN